jgi:hypothetical protein
LRINNDGSVSMDDTDYELPSVSFSDSDSDDDDADSTDGEESFDIDEESYDPFTASLKEKIHEELNTLKHIMDCLHDGDHNINIPAIMTSFPTNIIKSYKGRCVARPTASGFIDLAPALPSFSSMMTFPDYDAMEIDPIVITEPKKVEGILKQSTIGPLLPDTLDLEGTERDVKQEGKSVSFSANTEVFEYNPSQATNQGRKWSYGTVDFAKRTPTKRQSKHQRAREMSYLRKLKRALKKQKKRESRSGNTLTPSVQELQIVRQALNALRRDEEAEPSPMDF